MGIGMQAERVTVALLLLTIGWAACAQTTWDEAASRLRAASLAPEQVTAILERARAHGLDPRVAGPWAARAAGLAQDGIPSAILGERISQGLAKAVPVGRLESALADLDANVRWVNGLLDRITARAERRDNPGQTELALRAGEAALRAGLSRDQLERALGRRPVTLEQAVVFSQTASSLLAAGVSVADVIKALEGPAKAGLSAAEMQRLERRFVAELAGGRTPDEAFEDFRSELGATMRDRVNGPGSDVREGMRRQLGHEMRDTMRETLGGPGGGAHMGVGAGAGAGGSPGASGAAPGRARAGNR